MNEKRTLYHALRIHQDRCVGCTICMSKCPTGAIRIRNGKAAIRANWCTDCGECFISCPTKAFYVEEDDFEHIYQYAYRVALLPALFLSQFSKHHSLVEIDAALKQLGFTHIFIVETAVDAFKVEIAKQLKKCEDKPCISNYCPAATRLIQIKYPELTSHILPMISLITGAAILAQENLLQQEAKKEEIGIFYVTPCAAKIAEIKGMPSSESLVNGVINMDTLFNKVSLLLSKNKDANTENTLGQTPSISGCDMCWNLSGGEAGQFQGRTLAIDEIHNVMGFIEQMESSEELQNIDYLELRACDRGCVGGILTPANRFLAAERLTKFAQEIKPASVKYDNPNASSRKRLENSLLKTALIPLPKESYQGNFDEKLKQMEKVRKMMCYLPGIDCGACGAPECKVMAEDIVRDEAQLSNCIFLQRELEHYGKLDGEQAYHIIENVWGKDRLKKNCYKRGATLEGEQPEENSK